MIEAHRPDPRRLVLLVDDDVESRRHARHLLELQGLEVVQASNGIAALGLIQRLPESFRVVILDLDLPGLSGAVVIETLRIFRPDLPALCISNRGVVGAVNGRRCLAKPLQGPDLQAAIQDHRLFHESDGHSSISETSVSRARARYAAAGDLVEAALELARSTGPEEAG